MSICAETEQKCTKIYEPCEKALVDFESGTVKVTGRPMPITIGNRVMYRSDELYAFDKTYFYGCVRMRKIIEKRNLSQDDYMFAYQKKGQWIVCGKDYKKSKFLLGEKWVIENVRKMITSFPVDGDDAIQEAPPLLFLENDEKFKDKNGTVLEIEVRGERNHKLCYFKVKDVGDAFGMPSIQSTICNEKAYTRGLHYKCFICHSRIDNKQRIMKLLFLTYSGFQKLINVSRIQSVDNYTIYIMTKWLEQFDDTKLQTFIIPDIVELSRHVGYVYCVTSPLLNGVKIGFWTGTICGLRSRYITYFGFDIQLYTYYTMNPRELELNCHNHFSKHNISLEIFEKCHLEEYK